MIRNAKVIVLTLAVISAAGCAHSGHVDSLMGTPKWKPVKQRATTSPSEAEPPKILPETHFAAACLHEQQGLIGEAIKQYRKAIALNHNYVQAYHRLGVLLSRIGRPDEAVEVLQRAVRLKPDDPTLRNNLGYVFMLKGRWEEARRELARATELQPYFARAHVNLGMVLSKLERFDEAFTSFAAVLPEADAHYNVALMLRGQGRYEDAADAFREVLAIHPSFTAANAQLREISSYLTPTPPVESVAEAVTDDSQTRLPPPHEETLSLAEEEHMTSVEQSPPVHEGLLEPAVASSVEAFPDDVCAVEEQVNVTMVDSLAWFEEEEPCEDEIDEETLEAVASGVPGVVSEPISSPAWDDREAEVVSSPVDFSEVAFLEDAVLFDEDGNPCEDQFYDDEAFEVVAFVESEMISEPISSPAWDDSETEVISSPADFSEAAFLEDTVLFNEDGNPCEDQFYEEEATEVVAFVEPADTATKEKPANTAEIEARARITDSSSADRAVDEIGPVCEAPVEVLTPLASAVDWATTCIEMEETLRPIFEEEDPCWEWGADEPPVTLARVDRLDPVGPPMLEEMVTVVTLKPIPKSLWEGLAAAGLSRRPDVSGPGLRAPVEQSSDGLLTPVPASTRATDWRAKLRDLEVELMSVRTEIACWEEMLAELEAEPLIDVCFAYVSQVPLPDGHGSVTVQHDPLWAFFSDDIEAIASFARADEHKSDVATTLKEPAVSTPASPTRQRETMSMTVVPVEDEKESDTPTPVIDDKANPGKDSHDDKTLDSGDTETEPRVSPRAAATKGKDAEDTVPVPWRYRVGRRTSRRAIDPVR